jgi:hypothetical protein
MVVVELIVVYRFTVDEIFFDCVHEVAFFGEA